MTDEKIKNRLGSIIIVVIFLAGMTMLAYPSLSNYLAKRNVISGSAEYGQKVTSMSEEEIEAAWDKAVDYNDSLKGDPVKDPYIEGSGMALPGNYAEVLDVGDGIMGYISIPSIEVYIPIRHGTSDEVLEEGAGHLVQTALPIGGEGTHSVITAHTGYSKAKLFDHLTELEIGDKFIIYVLDKTLTYKVDNIQVILPEEIEELKAVEGEDYVTLVTCTPYGVNSHRLLVRGKRTANDENEEKMSDQSVGIPWQLIAIVAVSLITLTAVIWWGRRNRRKK